MSLKRLTSKFIVPLLKKNELYSYVTTFEKQVLQHINMIISLLGIDVRARGAFSIVIEKKMRVSVVLM